MKKTVSILSFLLLFGCEKQGTRGPGRPEHPSEPTPPTASRPRALSGYVLVRSGAPLFQSPDAKAPLIGGNSSGTKGAPSEVSVYRMLSEREDWVEIESLPMWAAENTVHCYERSEQYLSSAQLRFWVRRSDLHPVLTEAVTREFPDGSRVEVRPGAAVAHRPVPGRPDRYWIQVEGFELYLDVPKEHIGFSYRPRPARAASSEAHTRDAKAFTLRDGVDPSTVLSMGDSMVRLDESGAHSSSFQLRSRGPDGDVIETHGDCLDLTTTVAPDTLQEAEGGFGFGITDLPFLARAKAGATIYYRGGDVAGSAFKTMRLETDDVEVDADGERRCFRRAVRKTWVEPKGQGKGHWQVQSTLDLCFNKSDLTGPSAE